MVDGESSMAIAGKMEKPDQKKDAEEDEDDGEHAKRIRAIARSDSGNASGTRSALLALLQTPSSL